MHHLYFMFTISTLGLLGFLGLAQLHCSIDYYYYYRKSHDICNQNLTQNMAEIIDVLGLWWMRLRQNVNAVEYLG